ncbi:MAG: DUF445 family protein [Methanosarcinales archaeon]|nr:DUF445 family protein [Methanosarcinales archaeon]
MDYTPYFFPFIGAVIGYGTNYIAVKMLFRPQKPIKFGPFVLQGLLPKRRNDISKGIAATIEDELISMKDLSKVLKELDLTPLIDEMVDNSFSPDNNGKSDILSRINTGINTYLRNRAKRSINTNKDQLISEFIHEIERNVDFKEIIVNNIEAYDIEQLENIVLRVSSNELRHITIIGGILGFTIGFIQMIYFILT